MTQDKMNNQWEDKNGATNVDGFLKAFEKDDNVFWRMESGHAKNIIEELIERNKSEYLRGRETMQREAILSCEKVDPKITKKTQKLI